LKINVKSLHIALQSKYWTLYAKPGVDLIKVGHTAGIVKYNKAQS
jgi:hypothetical protein